MLKLFLSGRCCAEATPLGRTSLSRETTPGPSRATGDHAPALRQPFQNSAPIIRLPLRGPRSQAIPAALEGTVRPRAALPSRWSRYPPAWPGSAPAAPAPASQWASSGRASRWPLAAAAGPAGGQTGLGADRRTHHTIFRARTEEFPPPYVLSGCNHNLAFQGPKAQRR